jgi:hypothetical protein
MTTIIFCCPNCNQALRVGTDHAGKNAKCPRCGSALTIPATDSGSVPVYAESSSDRRTPRLKTEPPPITLFGILLLVGAGLLLANLALPWWRMSLSVRSAEELKVMYTGPREAYKKNAKDSARIVKDNLDWYRDRFSYRDYGRLFDVGEQQTTFSMMIWGIHTSAGILGLVFACLIVPPVVVAIVVAPVRRWVWTSSFASSVFGLIVMIFALTWIFSSPGESAGDVLQQGIVAGPWIGLLSGATLLTAGILDGIVGVQRLTAPPSGHPNS